MIHTEQGERVANFRAVIWLFSLKMSAIIFNIIHWCHCSSCLKAGGVLNDLEKRGIYWGVWHTKGWGWVAWSDTLWQEGVNGPWHDAQCRRILQHSMDRNFSAAIWEESLSLQGDAVRLRLLFSLQSQRDVAHQPYVATPRGREGQREELQDKRLQGPSLLDCLLSRPWNTSEEGLSLIAECCAESLYY